MCSLEYVEFSSLNADALLPPCFQVHLESAHFLDVSHVLWQMIPCGFVVSCFLYYRDQQSTLDGASGLYLTNS